MSDEFFVQVINPTDPPRDYYPDAEIVAYVKSWNMVPPGLPNLHRLYYFDTAKLWAYLTTSGEQFYKANQELLAPTMAEYERRVEAWSRGAVEHLLGDDESTDKGQNSAIIRPLLAYMKERRDHWNYTGGSNVVHSYQSWPDKRFHLTLRFDENEVQIGDYFEYFDGGHSIWGAAFPYSIEGIEQAFACIAERRATLTEKIVHPEGRIATLSDAELCQRLRECARYVWDDINLISDSINAHRTQKERIQLLYEMARRFYNQHEGLPADEPQ